MAESAGRTTPADQASQERRLLPHERPDFDPMKYIIGIDGRPIPDPWRVRLARFIASLRRRFQRKSAA